MKNNSNINLSLLNERGWETCASIARVELASIPNRPDIRKIKEKKWVAIWEKYWSTDKMVDFLQLHQFTILGSKDALIGVVWGNADNNGWFPPAIGDDPVVYLWRITSTVLNTLDTFGNVSNETLEQLGLSTALTKRKFK